MEDDWVHGIPRRSPAIYTYRGDRFAQYGRRYTRVRRISGISGTLALALVLLTGCSYGGQLSSTDPDSHLAVGVYAGGVPQSWSLLSEFTADTGVSPSIVVYYSAWYERFWPAFAQTAHDHGATVFVKLQPNSVTLASIAAGQSDTYLYEYARAVRAIKYPVLISFAHEMNGSWYPWGAGHASPAEFVAAWRHVVSVFRSVGATNVSWVWTVNSISGAEGDLIRWWPGANWVDLVGVDGYFASASNNYSSIFGSTIKQVRSFATKPVLIAETSVGDIPDREQEIRELFDGARADHVIGLIWFDLRQYPQDHDWRLEGDSAAIAAFKAAVRG
jgi:mannan endo-1,4-beta-mannosidase